MQPAYCTFSRLTCGACFLQLAGTQLTNASC